MLSVRAVAAGRSACFSTRPSELNAPPEPVLPGRPHWARHPVRPGRWHSTAGYIQLSRLLSRKRAADFAAAGPTTERDESFSTAETGVGPNTTEGVALPEPKRIDENEKEDKKEPEGGRPGPTDQGGDGGMATREIAPEITTAEDAQEPPD